MKTEDALLFYFGTCFVRKHDSQFVTYTLVGIVYQRVCFQITKGNTHFNWITVIYLKTANEIIT